MRFLLLPQQQEWLARRLVARRAHERALVALLEDLRDPTARVALETDLIETRESIARTRYLLGPIDHTGLAAAV